MLLMPQKLHQAKAGTGTNCSYNVQEQDKQHVELYKRHAEPAEQALPHEIASAETAPEEKPDATAEVAHAPEPAPKQKQEPAPAAI